MKIEDLVKHAEEFVSSNFNLELDATIVINGRLKSALGKFVREYNRYDELQGMEIELSKRLIDYYTDNEIISILEHELVHYCLFMTGKPFDDDSRVFIETCNYLKVPLTGTLRKKGKYHAYKCKCCYHYEGRKLNKNKTYYCNNCQGELIYSKLEVLR